MKSRTVDGRSLQERMEAEPSERVLSFDRTALAQLFGITLDELWQMEKRRGLRGWTLESICREWAYRRLDP